MNRGEARHAFARWLFFAIRGEFRVGDYEEIMNKASCLSPLSNAAVLWNTVQMACITRKLRGARNEIADEDLAHVWPLWRTRIIPNGALVQTPILSAMWYDIGQIKNPRSKLRGIGGRKEADQKNAASCGEYVPKEIQRSANLQIRIEAQFAPEPAF
jgi:hypothetical protein